MKNKLKEAKSNALKERVGAFFARILGAIKLFLYNVSCRIYRLFHRSDKKTGNLRKNRRGEKIFIIVMLIYPIMHFIVFYIYVNLNSILMSFQYMDISVGKFKFYKGAELFTNFKTAAKTLFGNPVMIQTMANSFYMFFFGLIISFPLSIIFSYFIFKKIPGHSIFKFVLFLPSIIPSVILALVFKLFLDGPIPDILKHLGVQTPPNFFVDPGWPFPTMIFYNILIGFATSLILFSGAMSRLPKSVLESAQLDGISKIRELWSIIIPMIWPTITTMLVLSIAGLFTGMGPLYTMYGDGAPAGIQTIGYYLLVIVIGREASMVGFPYAASLGLLFTLFVAPVTLLAKFLLEKVYKGIEY